MFCCLYACKFCHVVKQCNRGCIPERAPLILMPSAFLPVIAQQHLAVISKASSLFRVPLPTPVPVLLLQASRCRGARRPSAGASACGGPTTAPSTSATSPPTALRPAGQRETQQSGQDAASTLLMHRASCDKTCTNAYWTAVQNRECCRVRLWHSLWLHCTNLAFYPDF